ncbi:branched-chain amino acid ABC transporter permease [Bosea vaviloviae]|uniref:branched-chain amino acid ABC transporter permease n=1 Tax=Bosea vaviloviae TaxID=1526658 RepID=UPI0009F225DF|nr:branched-chain amino acid ABC transporter permease [Bosea vaviloviae]
MTISPSITSPDRRRLRLLGLLPWLFAGAVVGYAILVGGYAATVVSFALIYAVFVTGLNLFMGFAAQVSFGQNAFAAIGGYVSAVLTASHGWSPLPAMALGMAAAVLAAAIIGFPTLRLKGHYLAMGTLAIGLIAYEITVEWQSVTQGYMGISGIPPLSLAGYEVSSDRGQLVILALVVAGGAFAAARIRRSRFGRALSAVAGSEEAAQALGIDVARYKLMAFLLSAGFAALAGSLFVHVVGFVSPEVFGLHMVIVTFTMLYVGGIGTVAGPLIGALIVSLLPETFRAFKDYQDLAYGAALILLLIYAPRGLASLFSTRGRS